MVADIRCSFFFSRASATQFPEECSFYVEWCISPSWVSARSSARGSWSAVSALETHGTLGDLFVHKLFRELQECTLVLERISLRVSRTGSRVRSVFYIGQCHTDIRLRSPVTRMLRNYQSVETHIDIFCCSISQIKKCFSSQL
jgi:hypothetical protein